MRSHVEFLAERGYYAVSFDPPGTWESDGDINLYTTSNYLKAIFELIEYFDSPPTFIMGHSMGGSMSMYAAVRSDTVKAFAAIMSAPSFVREDNYDERVTRWQEAGIKLSYRDLPDDPAKKKEFRLPFSFSEDSRQYTAIEDLKTLTKPKLFVAGNKDTSVPVQIVKDAYRLAANPKELHILKSGHDYRRHPRMIKEVNQIVGNFLQ